MARVTEPEMRAAFEKCPREYHGTLLWLIGNQTPEAARAAAAAALATHSRRDGTA